MGGRKDWGSGCLLVLSRGGGGHHLHWNSVRPFNSWPSMQTGHQLGQGVNAVRAASWCLATYLFSDSLAAKPSRWPRSTLPECPQLTLGTLPAWEENSYDSQLKEIRTPKKENHWLKYFSCSIWDIVGVHNFLNELSTQWMSTEPHHGSWHLECVPQITSAPPPSHHCCYHPYHHYHCYTQFLLGPNLLLTLWLILFFSARMSVYLSPEESQTPSEWPQCLSEA